MAIGLLLRGSLILILLPAIVHAESHWESYAAWVQTYQWTCVPYYYTYCYNWNNYPYYLGYHSCTCGLFQPYASVCYTAVGLNCYTNCPSWIYVTLWKCQNGWSGCNCDIPICNPGCRSDQICSKPNFCDCYRSSTGECKYETCDDGPVNCYPGSCNRTTGNGQCVCPPGFSGPNCQTISNAPDINGCLVQIFGTPNGGNEQEVARANECAAQGLDPLPVWIGIVAANSLTRILATWEADYLNQLPLPGRGVSPYINNAPVPIGIVETNFTVVFPRTPSLAPRSVYCIGPDPVFSNPPTSKKCNQFMQFNDLGASSLIQSNGTFTVYIEAQLGGTKTGDPDKSGGRFYTAQNFVRDPSTNTTIRTAKFAFDLDTPYHCLSQSPTNCTVFPIFLNQSMTSNPVIQPTFNAWNDDTSGISRFHAEVFLLKTDINGLLVETGDPLVAADVNITLNNFRYTCPTPGAFSIILTVYDKANNSAKARKIFNYDNHDSSIAETTFPVYLDKANPDTNYTFITNLEKLQDPSAAYQFNLIWTGHFDTTYTKEWLGAVKPLPIGNTVIDDSKGTTFGLRSIDAVKAKTGVLAYEMASVVDANRTGGIGISQPSVFTAIPTDISTDRNQYPVAGISQLKDGDTIVVWLRVYDLYGNASVIQTRTYVDTSRFNTNVTKQEFKKQYPDQFNSSVAITVQNRISGIKNITYRIYDNTRKVEVYTGTMLPTVLEPPPAFRRKKRNTVQIPCRPEDATCYCIPKGDCFNTTQLINIDNCWIDRSVVGDEVIVYYTIYTLSGWSLDGTVMVGVLNAEDIECRKTDGGLTQSSKIGIGIAVAIAGILLILLILLLILMCVRWKVYRKHPVPTRIRATIHNTFGRNTASAVNIMSDNELYGTTEKGASSKLSSLSSGGESSIGWTKKLWDDGPAKSDDNYEDRLLSGKDLHMGDVIAEGRFAVVRKGFLNIGNEKTPVAIKVLRSGYDTTDPDVMKAKIAFLANKVQPHPNIIGFLGAVKEEKNQASPVMILELCDKTLKDWLSEVSRVDSEVFEDMVSFSLQIARGVQHLHSQGIIHRRLAVRNILLKRTIGGYEVKLIGFGPAREDHGNDFNNQPSSSVSVVPLKWMAPETLDTLDSGRPVYDERTDAWSYGVTLWEIYSKGEAPYANHKSPDMKAVLKRGERLNCPESCPPELFNQVLHPCWNSSPKKRPTFAKIITTIDQFRNGAGGGYYAAGAVQPGSQPVPTGYYAAGTLQQDNSSRPNNSAELYQDARSG